MKLNGRKVIVQDGNVEKAMRKFKKQVADSGVLQELQNKRFHTKPTTKRKMAKAQAKNRWQKFLRSQKLPTKLF